MARGWESKSVESQIADAASGSEKQAYETAQQREITSRRESLELSRRRVTRELEASHSAVHRAALENALSFLDGEIRKLQPRAR